MCCRVSSFFCGCADLRKGALIIGIVKLVNMMMRLVVMKTILMTIQYYTEDLTNVRNDNYDGNFDDNDDKKIYKY